jgi:glucans biosynthesis protein
MHGGAKGSGAPKGNQNALKHGTYTEVALRERAEMRTLIKQTEDLLRSPDEIDS